MPPAALEKLRQYIGTPCTCTWDGDAGTRIRFFDWAELDTKQQLLDTLFKECDVPGDYAEVIGTMSGGIAWMSGKLVPIAFLGEQDGNDRGNQLDAVVILDVSKPTGTVYAIPVRGTAVPQKKLTRAAASIEALKITLGLAAPRVITPAAPPKPKAAKKKAAPKGAKAAKDDKEPKAPT